MFRRSNKNPILRPSKKIVWENSQVYNPGAVIHNNKYYLLYRARGGAWISKIGLAKSKDGETFIINKKPIFEPGNDFEKNGVEDPRIVKIKNKFFMTYTAFDGQVARLNLAISKNLISWERQGMMMPKWNFTKAGGFIIKNDPVQSKTKNYPDLKKQWSKAGGIFPEIIDNKYWMLFGDRNLWLVKSDDCIKWNPDLKPFIKPRKKYFDSLHVEMGPPPIKTRKGWLVLYHGIDEKIVYRLGFLILDLKNPKKILYRSKRAIFEPEKSYELSGLVDILPGGQKAMETMSEKKLKKYIEQAKNNQNMPSVIFCNGAVLKKNILRIYYGASDSVICTATTNINNILKLYKD